MKVVVTGAAGRIGRNLVDRLIADGAAVRAVTLPDDPGMERLARAGAECLPGNLREPDFCEEAVAGSDAVVHLAAMLLFGSDDHNPALFEDNLRATANVLHAAARLSPGLRRFVFASSDEVYPSLDAAYLPIDEGHPTRPYSYYGATKLLGEELVHIYRRTHGLPGTIARFALTIEPWEALDPERPLGNFLHLRSMIAFVRSRAGEEAASALESHLVPGTDQLWVPRDATGAPWLFHFCDVRDLVGGLLLLLEQPSAVGEAFNLSGPAPFSFAEAVPYLAARTGKPVVEATVPGPPLRIHHSTAKARGMLGYHPKHDVFATFDAALADASGGAR